MKKTKTDQSNKKTKNMLGREKGSMEDIRTHEDFNNTHPNELEEQAVAKDNSKVKKKALTKKK